jgi:hypothetical protein
MRFKIDGVTSDAGKDANFTVQANSEDDAAAKARALGILPHSISELYSPPPVFSPPPIAPGQAGYKPLTVWGWILIIGGLCVACFFGLIYDTTVSTTFFEADARIHNMGLQQNRMLGCIAGLIAAAVGIVMVAIDAKLPDKEDREFG